MNPFPEDIFTEPDNVDPDTLANLGPLRRLAGIWESSKGVDLNPKADGPQRREFSERIELQPIDAQANGPQLFYGLRYHTHILASDEDATFHDQIGYWLWEPATGLVLQTLTIPRGQVAIASGRTRADRVRHLLDGLPGIRLPDRLLSSRSHLQCRRQLELRVRHHADGARAPGTLPPSRPEHAREGRRTDAQSTIPTAVQGWARTRHRQPAQALT